MFLEQRTTLLDSGQSVVSPDNCSEIKIPSTHPSASPLLNLLGCTSFQKLISSKCWKISCHSGSNIFYLRKIEFPILKWSVTCTMVDSSGENFELDICEINSNAVFSSHRNESRIIYVQLPVIISLRFQDLLNLMISWSLQSHDFSFIQIT